MPDSALSRVDVVNRFLLMNFSKDKELQQIVELAAGICAAPVAMLTFMDDQSQHVRFKIGTDIETVPYQDTFCKHTILQQEIMVVTDATVDERMHSNTWVVNEPHIRFYAGSSLTTHDDHNIGTLCVFDTSPKTLTPTQEKMLHRLARQVSLLLEFDASLLLLKEQHEASQVEETKLRSFFESSTSCHLLLDTSLKVVAVNNAMRRILSRSYCVEIEDGMSPQHYVVPTFFESFISSCNRALNGEYISLEAVVMSAHGDIPWLHTYEPAYDWQGVICGVTYSATDITQTLRHENRVIKQEASLQQIDRIVSAGLHEPMEVIRAAMEGLKQQGYPDDIEEFGLLEITCEELREKGALITAPEFIYPHP